MNLGENFISAVRQLADERNLSVEIILASIEDALALAYRKYREGKLDPVVTIDRNSGDVRIFEVKRVVDSDPGSDDIDIEEARIYGGENILVGETVRIPVKKHPAQFGRIAAQTARQVITQRLKDAQREIVYNEFNDKIGQLISAKIFKNENDQVFVHMGERNEALLPREQRIPGEEYPVGETMKFYLLDVRQTGRGPRIIVSRVHPALLRKLLELEIPEIADGTVEIKGVVREAGARAKVAVASNVPGVDPVGACVGNSGNRIVAIRNELCGEKIDIIVWDENPLEFIKNSLSPAKVTDAVEVADAENTARVYAPADQLSLAIGKAGQNVRLAARLTGWKVDITTREAEASAAAAGVEEVSAEDVAEVPAGDVEN